MSSETSTKRARLEPDASDAGLQPWQFFVLAALGCATAVTFMARGQGPTAVILLGVLMATAALVGYAALRALRPLVSLDEDRTVMVGQRTRVALEREKMMTLRSIKELEFDSAMGKLSPKDFEEMGGRLRARAIAVMKQLDEGGSAYREIIERELSARMGAAIGDRSFRLQPEPAKAIGEAKASPYVRPQVAPGTCASCGTANDHDAAFCKRCGTKLEGVPLDVARGKRS
jgi:hypothetical protein